MLRTEAEDKGLDSNGDAETLHAEAKDNLLDTIEKWTLQYCGNACTIEEWKLSHFASVVVGTKKR